MYRPFLGDFMLCIHLEYAVTQRLSEGPLLHQFASRFTPLKSPRSRDSFFEKTVPCSGMKCSELTAFPAIYHVYTGFPRHTRPFPEFSNMLSPYKPVKSLLTGICSQARLKKWISFVKTCLLKIHL